MKKVIRLKENDIERLVKKIIKEDDGQPQVEKKEKTPEPIRMHQVGDGVLPTIDDIILAIQKAKMSFESLVNTKLTGKEGYAKEIDGIVNDFTKLEDKVRKSKEKISSFVIQQREKKKVDHMAHRKMEMRNKRREAEDNGNLYAY